MDAKKTFRMPKDMLEKWLAALRSGEYKQAKGCLYDAAEDAYCCLGLLQKIVDGKVEDRDKRAQIPSPEWAGRRGISSSSLCLLRGFNPTVGDESIAEKNDAGMSFPDIADLLEKYAEVY